MSSLTYDLTLAGLSVGAAAALSGVGLIVTYRATGVLNFAHGALAMLCAYLLRQFVVVWSWPLWAGAALVLLVVAPALGLALERLVFRPLAKAGADPARTLVASIGVFVLLVGAAAMVWGTGAQEDAPTLISADPWGQLTVACALAVAVWAVTRWTRFGGELRAVVDNRSLAVLGGIDADRVAAVGWAFGAFTAGLTGVLLAPYVRLDPYGLPLLVMEVVAVAVAARMRLLSVAVLVALAIGVAQSQLTRLHPDGRVQPLLQAVGANLFVVALLVAALALPGIGGRDALPRAVTRRVVPAPPGAWLVTAVLFLLPLGFAGSDLHTSIQVPALALILLSLVVVTGRAGQLALGQGAFAGLGALFATLLTLGRFPGVPQLPALTALLISMLLVAPLGLLTAVPAISRHGLALALATFAVGVGVSRFVFAQPYAATGLAPGRPAGFGSDRAFYVLELALLTGALILVRALRRGRVGRALAAVRDHEAGASAAGVPVPALKVAVFVVGAGLAALGGGLLAFALRSFDPGAYDPVRGLLWFAAIVVLGADSPLGALAGAALLVGLDAGTRGGVAAGLVGLLAVTTGRLPSVRGRGRRRLTVRGVGVRGVLGAGAEARAGAGGSVGEQALGGRRAPRPEAKGSDRRQVPEGRRAPRPGADGPNGVDGPEGLEGLDEPRSHGPHEPNRLDESNRLPDGPDGLAGPGKPHGPNRPHDPDGPGGPGGPNKPHGPHEPNEPNRLHKPRSHGPHQPNRLDEPNRPPDRPDRPDRPHQPHRPGEQQARRVWRALRWIARRSETPPRTAPPADSARPTDLDTPATPTATPATPGHPPPPETHEHRPFTTPSPPSLSATGLTVTFNGRRVLDGVDITVPGGRITAVVGPNGAGKSTLFHCLAGTLRPGGGRVRFGGRDVTGLPAHARTRLGVARTFQQLVVFPSLTVAENIRVGAEQGRVRDPAVTGRLLALFGLRGDALTADLPTGALRRVELARALAGRPHALLLDEPAAGLDEAEVADLARLLKTLAADGTALFVVEHDLDLVTDLADTVHVMTAGRIVTSGPPRTALARPPDSLDAP
ncbi:ATP-binding cassette domain-containing protein [Streptomyces sp. NPDC050095]|uniref:ABC transporter permease subunit n=1 Tax=unclassified Streptomyces TaxID=2593676 RepID=UPI003431208C